MTTEKRHAQIVQGWARKVATATERREAAVKGRDEAIVAMRRDGATLQAIAQAAGLSHPTIIDVLRRTPDPTATPTKKAK